MLPTISSSALQQPQARTPNYLEQFSVFPRKFTLSDDVQGLFRVTVTVKNIQALSPPSPFPHLLRISEACERSHDHHLIVYKSKWKAAYMDSAVRRWLSTGFIPLSP